MTEEFQEIAHSGGQIIFHFRTTAGMVIKFSTLAVVLCPG